MARHLGVTEEICNRAPTTDTYSLAQSQEDFYFALPYATLDLVLWAKNHAVPAAEVGEVLGFSEQQVQRVYEDIDQKRRTTAYLHAAPILLEPVPEREGF
jgi:NAD+ synthase